MDQGGDSRVRNSVLSVWSLHCGDRVAKPGSCSKVLSCSKGVVSAKSSPLGFPQALASPLPGRAICLAKHTPVAWVPCLLSLAQAPGCSPGNLVLLGAGASWRPWAISSSGLCGWSSWQAESLLLLASSCHS